MSRMNVKDYIDGYCVSTVALMVEHSWGPGEGGYWFETYIFPSDGEKITDWLEVWGTRYHTEDEARAGHDDVCAKVRAGDLPPRERTPNDDD